MKNCWSGDGESRKPTTTVFSVIAANVTVSGLLLNQKPVCLAAGTLNTSLAGSFPMIKSKNVTLLFQILKDYKRGMAKYDACHPPTLRSQWAAFSSEIGEFAASPSWEEAWDVLHSCGWVVG